MKIKDMQIGGCYAFGGHEFATTEEVRKQLASYHSIDVEGTERMSLDDLLEIGSWEIEQ